MRAQRLCEAVLLKSANYREADRILTFLTADLGKISVLARGARRSTRRFQGVLEPFAVVKISVRKPRVGMWALVEAKMVGSYPRMLGSLARMTVAGRALDTVRLLVAEEVPDSPIYCETVAMLHALDRAEDRGCGAVSDCFRARVIALSGLAPDLSHCGLCGKLAGVRQPARFDPQRGHLVCSGCGVAPVLLSGRARQLFDSMAHEGVAFAPKDGWQDAGLETQLSALLSGLLKAQAP